MKDYRWLMRDLAIYVTLGFIVSGLFDLVKSVKHIETMIVDEQSRME